MKFEVKITFPNAETSKILVLADGRPWYEQMGHIRNGLRVNVAKAEHTLDVRLDARPAYESE